MLQVLEPEIFCQVKFKISRWNWKTLHQLEAEFHLEVEIYWWMLSWIIIVTIFHFSHWNFQRQLKKVSRILHKEHHTSQKLFKQKQLQIIHFCSIKCTEHDPTDYYLPINYLFDDQHTQLIRFIGQRAHASLGRVHFGHNSTTLCWFRWNKKRNVYSELSLPHFGKCEASWAVQKMKMFQ